MHGQAFGSTRDNPVRGLLRSRTSPLADGRHPLKMGLRARIPAMQGDVFDAPHLPLRQGLHSRALSLPRMERIQPHAASNLFAATLFLIFAGSQIRTFLAT